MKRSGIIVLLVFVAIAGVWSCKKATSSNDGSGTTTTTVPPVVIPVTPVTTSFKTLNYLVKISGLQTVSGIHNREPNAKPSVWTDSIHTTTGKYPALWSGDFLFQQDNINNRQVMINQAVTQWGNGSIVHLMWHACNPALAEPCGYDSNGVLSKMTDQQWSDLFTSGTTINTQWRSMMDEVCIYLQQLKDKNIEVLWRPLHEMNQGSFWWGGRPGPNGTLKLYQQMHDYMTKTKGLTNLIWIWDMQDFGTLSNDVTVYNPGADYWDIAALDVYDGSGYTTAKYNTMVSVAQGKPIAIGECSVLPTATILTQQPKWTFFMSWSELTYTSNSTTQIQQLYNSANVITRDKMPGWK
jgi:mannan endo-1,4-beta-mannosidase